MTLPDYATVSNDGWRITNIGAVQAPDLSVWVPYCWADNPVVGMRLFWVNHTRGKLLPYSWQGFPIAPTNPPKELTALVQPCRNCRMAEEPLTADLQVGG